MRKSLLSAVADSTRIAPAKQEADAPGVAMVEREIGPRANSRAGLKHVGAYLDDETVERVAILRARLKLDNSQLVKQAIDELFDRQRAEGAFKRRS